MKTIIISVIFVVTFISCRQATQTNTASTMTRDTALIRKLGADEYGYKQYVIVFLKQGTNQNPDSVAAAKTLSAHLKYLKGLMDQGKLLLLGPVLEQAEVSGICIFNSQNVDEVKALAEADPAVQAGEVAVEAHLWYGPAALVEIPQIHAKLETKSFGDMQ